MDRKGLFFIACFSGMLLVVNLFFSQNSIRQKAERLTQQERAQQPAVSDRAVDQDQSLLANSGAMNQTEKKSEDPLFLLENQTLQLVIDSKGGSLREINLPLKSKSNPSSVIQKIEFDTRLECQSPKEATFPLMPKGSTAMRFDKEGKSQFVTSQLGQFYPLLRRSSSDQYPYLSNAPSHFGAQIISPKSELSNLTFRPLQVSDQCISLQAWAGSRRITKTFALSPAPHCFLVKVKVEGDRSGLWLTSGVPEVEMLSGASSPQIKYQIDKSGKQSTVKVDLPRKKAKIDYLRPNWLCNSNGFFGLIMRPLTSETSGFRVEKISGDQLPSRLCALDQDWNRFPPESLPGYQVSMPLASQADESVYQFFAGPLSQNVLAEVDRSLAVQKGQIDPNFASCQSFHGWFAFISQPFAKLLMFLMNGFYKVTRSWAISICLLTVALRIMLYPLNSWSMISTRRMRDLAPLIQQVQEKYKKEPQKAQKEVLQLYRDNNINPLSGCLPLLLQMPFLIGMFDLLKSSFELRGASFIPGWIDDLSAPDVLFTWSTPLPFFGHELHVLPLLVGLAMYWQQMMNSPQASSDQELSEQQKQQKTIGNIMTLVFAAMFYHFPSGLNIYWLSSILLGIGQQSWFQRAAAKPILSSKSAGQ